MKFLLFLGSFVGLVIKLSSNWPEGSKAKCYRVGHYPEDPIRKRSHFLQDLEILGIVRWKLGRFTLADGPW